MDLAEKLDMKLFHCFNKELNGAENYLKLAKEYPDFEMEFLEQAEIEHNQAEEICEIYEQMYLKHHPEKDVYDDNLYETMKNKLSATENKIARYSRKK